MSAGEANAGAMREHGQAPRLAFQQTGVVSSPKRAAGYREKKPRKFEAVIARTKHSTTKCLKYVHALKDARRNPATTYEIR
jgi:hypothetical protein